MIHPTAIIHPGAQLADNVSIGAYSTIGEHVVIGAGTTIASHVVVEGWTELGQ
jgi:UDP-N-acetylglucosamine acyltransferase